MPPSSASWSFSVPRKTCLFPFCCPHEIFLKIFVTSPSLRAGPQTRSQGGCEGCDRTPPQTAEVHFFKNQWRFSFLEKKKIFRDVFQKKFLMTFFFRKEKIFLEIFCKKKFLMSFFLEKKNIYWSHPPKKNPGYGLGPLRLNLKSRFLSLNLKCIFAHLVQLYNIT